MARLSINELTTYRWSLEEDLAQYQAAGITAIGVWRQKLADYGEPKGIALLAESGLKVSNLLWAGGFTGSDGRTYADSLHDAMDAIRTAAAMHAGCLIVYSGGRNNHTQNHARRLFYSAIEALLPLAVEHDVTLAIEPMHAGCAEEWTFLTSLSEAASLVELFNSRNLQLAFDTYHLGHEPDVLDQIRRLASRIAIVHLGDGHGTPDCDQNRTRLGQGTVPLQEIVAALVQSGYLGYYDVELVGEEIETGCYKKLLADSKSTFELLLRTASCSGQPSTSV